MFVKKSILLSKPAFIWSKIQQKQLHFEICLPLKITVFYFNVIWDVIDSWVFSISHMIHSSHMILQKTFNIIMLKTAEYIFFQVSLMNRVVQKITIYLKYKLSSLLINVKHPG